MDFAYSGQYCLSFTRTHLYCRKITGENNNDNFNCNSSSNNNVQYIQTT